MGNIFRILILVLYFALSFAFNNFAIQNNSQDCAISNAKTKIEINIADSDSNFIAPDFNNTFLSNHRNSSFNLNFAIDNIKLSFKKKNNFKFDSYKNLISYIPDSHLSNSINTRAP